MANSFKNLWLIVVLIAAGAVIFFLSFKSKPQPQGVVLQEVFNQVPQAGGDPVPAPAIVTSPVGGQEAGFAVQVYSFQDEQRAEKALADLKQAGYKAFTVVSDLGEKGTWYRVRIGGLDNEQQAKAMLEQIRKNYKSGFIIKPVSSKK